MDVGTATSGDRAEFFSVRNHSDNTSGLKLESISLDRQRPHHFLADLKAALRSTQPSPTLLTVFMLEAEFFLHKMLTPGGGLHADAGLSQIDENDGTLFADQVAQSMRLNFSGQSRVWRRRGQACTCATERRRSCSPTVTIHDRRLVREDCEKRLSNRRLNGVQPK